jgi:hypothetical protein
MHNQKINNIKIETSVHCDLQFVCLNNNIWMDFVTVCKLIDKNKSVEFSHILFITCTSKKSSNIIIKANVGAHSK